jgi:hypothetical protein
MNTDWIKWHAAELAAVTAPAVGAVATDQWWLLIATGVFTAQWLRHEIAHRPQPCPVNIENRRREPVEMTVA